MWKSKSSEHHIIATLKAIDAGRAPCLSGGLTCDGIVTGIQIKERTGDIAAYRIIKNPNKTAMAATCFS
jgi:hypothetical protein